MGYSVLLFVSHLWVFVFLALIRSLSACHKCKRGITGTQVGGIKFQGDPWVGACRPDKHGERTDRDLVQEYHPTNHNQANVQPPSCLPILPVPSSTAALE